MGDGTKIAWTHNSFNPWWGCTRVSPGCEHCYAETFAKRAGFGPTPRDPKKFPIWGLQAGRRFFGEEHWRAPIKWNERAALMGERERVFCASMADVFEDVLPTDEEVARKRFLPRADLDERVTLARRLESERARLWDLIEDTPQLDWLLLTKRPQNILRMVPMAWRKRFPLNVWIGTTAEDQKRADERIPHLLDVPAVVRFVSYEPALGPVFFSSWLAPRDHVITLRNSAGFGRHARPLDWIIVGGESGPKARTFHLDWARSVVRQTRGSSCSVFVKQLGDRSFDYVLGDTSRVSFDSSAAADWNEWAGDLRVREVPIPFWRRNSFEEFHTASDREVFIPPEVRS